MVRHGDAMERRAAFAADVRARTDIDEDMIRSLVHTSYDRVRTDVVWSSVVLMTGHYHGRPMQKHAPLPVDAAHFDRWLTLFADTANKICPPAAADLFIERAHMHDRREPRTRHSDASRPVLQGRTTAVHEPGLRHGTWICT
jgi:hypothetical protein